MRASIRGVDLILEQGMNVRICTFPEGEDPDSFARNNSLEVLEEYIDKHSQDFIAFKASLLAKEAENDPIKKAETIRDMVVSISKIPDTIKREVYIKECSRIMDISEDVLFNTLAQLLNKNFQEAAKKTPNTKPFEIVNAKKDPTKKVDPLYELERKIIELLLLYGTKEEEFEDLILETDEKGKIAFKPEITTSKVFEKIYLDLQEDEIEFANDDFKILYTEIISKLNLEQDFQVSTFINDLEAEKASAISDILMNEDKYVLHDWARNLIYVTEKKDRVSQMVNETILNLRRYLITLKIKELISTPIIDGAYEDKSVLETVRDYNTLHSILSEKLRRVL